MKKRRFPRTTRPDQRDLLAVRQCKLLDVDDRLNTAVRADVTLDEFGKKQAHGCCRIGCTRGDAIRPPIVLMRPAGEGYMSSSSNGVGIWHKSSLRKLRV